jgi:hypothetical protein
MVHGCPSKIVAELLSLPGYLVITEKFSQTAWNGDLLLDYSVGGSGYRLAVVSCLEMSHQCPKSPNENALLLI